MISSKVILITQNLSTKTIEFQGIYHIRKNHILYIVILC
jgi:uncharacterized membrane-anchored protein YitT (DUF2179 family)